MLPAAARETRRPRFRITIGRWRSISQPASTACLTGTASTPAQRALVAYSLEGDEGPVRELRLGPDRAGNLLEIVVLLLDDQRQLVIHAMRMRPKYRELLP